MTRPGRRAGRPLVVDLSALWAGPLCGQLLRLAGAEVVKVECRRRPDGARRGNATFYGLLNQGKRCLALDLAEPEGQRVLRRLLLAADVVIEASRPRALRQMGIDAAAILRANPRLTWISITGYGRAEPAANWIAYGDDAGVAAGLSEVMRRATGGYQLAGDAVADPLTGLRAALAGWRSWLDGGGRLISLALVDVAARSLHDEVSRRGPAVVVRSFADWWTAARGGQAPGWSARVVTAKVGKLGDDTSAVLAGLDSSC